MSDDRFDELSRAVATTTSRRHALKLLAGGLIGALAGGVFASRSRAQHLNCVSSTDCHDPVKQCCCFMPKRGNRNNQVVSCVDRDVCTQLGGFCVG